MPIPHFVRDFPRSAELACLHEGGHVLALAREGVFPEFVELYAEPDFHARTRAPVLPGSERRGIAAGGTAVEIALFNEGRLVDGDGRQIAEREFVIEAIGQNAATDKLPFFGADRREADGVWPKGDDEEYVAFARTLSDFVDMDFVEAFAGELLAKGRLEKAEIEALADRFDM